jgi:hypothetical protein
MRRRILGLLALPLAAGLSLWAIPAANAAPINCPGGQTATKVSPGEWECVNRGGNTSNAEDPKNPNAGKDKF